MWGCVSVRVCLCTRGDHKPTLVIASQSESPALLRSQATPEVNGLFVILLNKKYNFTPGKVVEGDDG